MRYVFDIDGTILESDIHEDGTYFVLKYNIEMIKKINSLYEKGNQIIIYTGRHWNHLINTKKDLDYIGLKYHTLIMGKPVADFYVDDKAMRPEEFLNE